MIKNFSFYFLYFILNIIFFSFLSIYTYQLLCTNTTSLLITNNYDTNISFNLNYFFNTSLNTISESSIYIFDNVFIIKNLFVPFYKTSFFYLSTHYILASYLSEIDLHHFLLYNNVFKVYFFTKLPTNYDTNITFECLQNIIYLYPNETSLVFFRLESNCSLTLVCLTIYIIYPLKLSFLITKIQCFCFSNVLLHPNELIELPILFYIDNFFTFSEYKIYIYYLLLIVS